MKASPAPAAPRTWHNGRLTLVAPGRPGAWRAGRLARQAPGPPGAGDAGHVALRAGHLALRAPGTPGTWHQGCTRRFGHLACIWGVHEDMGRKPNLCPWLLESVTVLMLNQKCESKKGLTKTIQPT